MSPLGSVRNLNTKHMAPEARSAITEKAQKR
jgi:hypothetical protein